LILIKKKAYKFFSRLQKLNPEPRGELFYVNNYTLLVAVVLSAQATDVGVNKATSSLFKKITNPEDMIKLGEKGLKSFIKSIGLYNSKAKNIIALSEMLIREFEGKIPRERDLLQKLPGVGRKTANVVLNIAFGEETIAVDTHIFRVGNRTGLAEGRSPLEVEMQLERNIPKKFKRHAHHWLILHGRYTCKARRPECFKCEVEDLCEFSDKIFLKKLDKKNSG